MTNHKEDVPYTYKDKYQALVEDIFNLLDGNRLGKITNEEVIKDIREITLRSYKESLKLKYKN